MLAGQHTLDTKNGLLASSFYSLRHCTRLHRIWRYPLWSLLASCKDRLPVCCQRMAIKDQADSDAYRSESCKLICALAFHFRWHRANTRVPNASIPPSWFQSLLPRSTTTGQVDYQICFYTAVPALLYLINNVFYLVGLRFVSPALLNTAMLAKVSSFSRMISVAEALSSYL